MSLVDVLVPLAIGLLMVLRPQTFFKPSDSQAALAKRAALFRKIGSVLVGVAVLYAAIALARP